MKSWLCLIYAISCVALLPYRAVAGALGDTQEIAAGCGPSYRYLRTSECSAHESWQFRRCSAQLQSLADGIKAEYDAMARREAGPVNQEYAFIWNFMREMNASTTAGMVSDRIGRIGYDDGPPAVFWHGDVRLAKHERIHQILIDPKNGVIAHKRLLDLPNTPCEYGWSDEGMKQALLDPTGEHGSWLRYIYQEALKRVKSCEHVD